METLPAAAGPDTDSQVKHGTRIILACAIGNFVEWFDFTLYGFSVTVLATVFFPPENRTAALVATLAIYGVTFVARPIGAVFFGRLGDRRGRRTALASSIVVMGVATAAMGLLPGYQTIGLFAPVLLLLCRLAQGFSAGGEYTGAATFVVEHAPDKRRALWVALAVSSTGLAAAAATATVLISRRISEDGFASGGWRWPFVIGGLLALGGVYLRLKLAETPVYTEISADQSRESQPLRRLLRDHRRTLAVLFVFFSYVGVLTHLFFGYLPSYLEVAVGVNSATTLYAILAVELVLIPFAPLAGVIADRFGRRPLLRIGAFGGLVSVIPSFHLIGTGNLAGIVVGLMFLMLSVAFMGTALVALLEMYPANVRFSGVALPYNVAYAVFAGTAPLISEALVRATGDIMAPAYYATAIALIACPIVFRAIPETRHANLRDGAVSPSRSS